MALEDLTPIVREEQLLAGEDLEPVTRLEYFLKQAGSGGSGSVPIPTPTAADTGKVLTANNGAVNWAEASGGSVEPIYTAGEPKALSKTYSEVLDYVQHGNTCVIDIAEHDGVVGYTIGNVALMGGKNGSYTVVVTHYEVMGGLVHDVYKCQSADSYPTQSQ